MVPGEDATDWCGFMIHVLKKSLAFLVLNHVMKRNVKNENPAVQGRTHRADSMQNSRLLKFSHGMDFHQKMPVASESVCNTRWSFLESALGYTHMLFNCIGICKCMNIAFKVFIRVQTSWLHMVLSLENNQCYKRSSRMNQVCDLAFYILSIIWPLLKSLSTTSSCMVLSDEAAEEVEVFLAMLNISR